MRRAAIIAGIGWAGIVQLAWWQASQRLGMCPSFGDNEACLIRMTTARDNTLIWGASVMLVIVVVAMAGVQLPRWRWTANRVPPAGPEQPTAPQLR